LEKSLIDNHHRYAIKADILINNKIIKILGTHLDVYDETEELRLRQTKKIIENIDNSFLIFGDPNALRKKDYDKKTLDFIKESNEYRDVDTVYKVTNFLESNGFTDSFVKSVNTCPIVSVWSYRRVDYIYIGNEFNYKVIFSGIYPTLASDHYPIYCDIKLL